MKFKSINEIEQFDFQDTVIHKMTVDEEEITLALEAVIVRAKNSNNANYTDSYAGDLLMHLTKGNIQKAVKEGYKYYDANDVLVEEVPDLPLTKQQIADIMKNADGYYLFDMVKVDDAQNTTGHFLYLLGIDTDEETTYWFQIEFTQSVLEWDRYLNRVQRV